MDCALVARTKSPERLSNETNKNVDGFSELCKRKKGSCLKDEVNQPAGIGGQSLTFWSGLRDLVISGLHTVLLQLRALVIVAVITSGRCA